MELKHILARQPGPEVAEQLRIYQESLRSKTKQMKVRLMQGFPNFLLATPVESFKIFRDPSRLK